MEDLFGRRLHAQQLGGERTGSRNADNEHAERANAERVTAHEPGPPDGEMTPAPLLLVHGFTQTAQVWGRFGDALAAHRNVFGIDLPGHGSAGGTVAADLPETARLLAAAAGEVAINQGGGAKCPAPIDVLGYSLGARVVLHALVAAPERFGHAVLIGATAGIDDPDERRQRRARDEATADELERSGDLDGFLRRWLAAPMFAGIAPGAAGFDERRRNTASGLASSLRTAGTGTQQPIWDKLDQVDVPVLVLVGADDPRFVVAGLRLAAGLPASVLSLVPGAGHAAHLQQPAICARLVENFLAGGGDG